MRQKSLLLCSVLVIAGAVYLAVHTNSTSVQAAKVQVSAAAKQVQQSIATNHKLQAQIKVDNQEIQTLQAQCQIGVKDYQVMTSTERLHATLPVCALQNASASVQ